VLVPRRAHLTEIHGLSHAERRVLIEEIARAGKSLKEMTGAEKVNIGALGNVVPQLHIHVVARESDDAAWPGPVWGRGTRMAYEEAALIKFTERLRGQL
jgi:diadenosine tetraphosphate (Ap4A) HIT family hydrolase